MDEIKVPALVVMAVLAGSGSSLGINLLSDPRPDPWTGSDARTSHNAMREEWHDDLDRVFDLRGQTGRER